MGKARQNISKYKHFCKSERDELSILLKKGYSLRDIAITLKKNHSSVSRELKRNMTKGEYDPERANDKARTKRLYSKFQGMKIRNDPAIEKYVHEKIGKYWSPEDVSEKLKRERKIAVSFKTIYKYIYRHPCGYELQKYLKYQGKDWKRCKSPKWGEIIKNRVFIGERPAVINQRKRIGDFEADTMGKPRRTRETLAVLRDRKSRKMFALKVPRLKYAMDGYKILSKEASALSLTLDNGLENCRHQELNIPTYFCNPYHSWEKGSVENGIGCIRRFIPKKADLASYSQESVSAIVEIFNNKPMRCLDYQTPNEVFKESSPISGRYP